LARHRREIANNHCQRSVLLSTSADADDAIVTVVTDEPLESGGFTVQKRRRAGRTSDHCDDAADRLDPFA
jgi:hypothetical protein